MDETLELLTIALLPGVQPRTVRELAGRGPLREILARAGAHADLLPAAALAALATGAAQRAAEREAAEARRRGARIVGRDDRDYPTALRAIYDPPPVLYVRGALCAGDAEASLAIVGARGASPQGQALARAMAAELAGSGASIVSGLARGIDSAAHRGALDARGRTLAVLGCGIDQVYPPENAGLAAAIAERGAVVSEFPLGTPPRPGNFPRRNRVLAGWGRAVVVVEAAERSGALVTARLALEEGREVMAVPGHPSHPLAAGTNALIRDGARLVRGAADVAEELGLRLAPPARNAGPSDVVLEALRGDAPSSLEELAERSGEPAALVLTRLTELELADKVRRLPGALFIRN